MSERITEISLSRLQELASAVRKDLRSRGAFPDHKRVRPRTEDKERALLAVQIQSACRYGVRRAPDGTYFIQALAGKTLADLRDIR